MAAHTGKILELLSCALFRGVCTILLRFKLHHQTLNLNTHWPYVQTVEIKMDRQLQGCSVLHCAQCSEQSLTRAGTAARLIGPLAVSARTSRAPEGKACSRLNRALGCCQTFRLGQTMASVQVQKAPDSGQVGAQRRYYELGSGRLGLGGRSAVSAAGWQWGACNSSLGSVATRASSRARTLNASCRVPHPPSSQTSS